LASVSLLLWVQAEPRIAGWAMEGSSITAKDQSGAVLWQREFGFQVEHSAANPLHGSIADLDGDGSEELICIPIQPVVGGRGLYVFEGDGRLRFQHGVDRKVTFGDIGYTGFLAVRQWITPNDDGSSSIWLVANHTDQFPSVLQRLDANGSMLSEYWSNGHIETVASARMRGRHYLLVGGTNNEFKQASLAVLDYDTATGMAPATNTQYECVDCPARLPLHYFVFPSPELWRWRVTSMAVGPFGLKVSDTKEPITVSFDARAERALGYPDPIGWSAIYRLNSHFQFTRAEYGSDYLHAHAILQQLNNLDHAYTTAHEDELWPVLRWKDGTFAEESPLGRAQKK
jgi:hypothetical protein